MHNCLKINQLCGDGDYFSRDEKASIILDRPLSTGNVPFGIIVE